MSFGKIFWGFVFLFIGVALLGNNFNWWNINIWQSIASLWPIILILLGISIAFGESSPIAIVLFIIVLIGSLLYITSPGKISDDHFSFNVKNENNNSVTTRNYTFPLAEIQHGQINLDLGAANINFNALNNNDSLYEASFRSSSELNIQNQIEGDVANINMKDDFQGFSNFTNGTDRKFDLNLSKKIPFDLRINSGASKLGLNLRELIVNNLEISAGASSQEITISNLADLVKVKIDAGASKIKLNLPKEFSLKILNESGLLKNNFEDLSLNKSGNTYKSSDFDSNTKKIDLEIRAGASNITIERY